MSVIAVFSGPFSEAEAICEQVAGHLDYSLLLGDALLARAAEQHHTREDKLARAMTSERSFFGGLTHEREKSLIYLRATLAEVIAEDNVVLLSPAVHLIPRAITHVMRVCVAGGADFRQAVARKQAGLEGRAAAEAIKTADQELAHWTQLLCSAGPWDPALYDIKIPRPAKSVREAVRLICEHVTAEALMPTDLSIQAALDLRLGARVNLALLSQGHHYCSVTAESGRVTVAINKPPGSGALARALYSLRLESLERELKQIARGVDGVTEVQTRPGAGLLREGPLRALLVDDEEEYVTTLSERLEMRDIETSVVHDGEQALSSVDVGEPEVMVLDLRMPGIDGIEVLRRVKRAHPGVEVIVVTGHGSAEDERVARELGAFDYLAKPVDINVLAERMKAAVRKVRGEDDDEGRRKD